VRFRAWLSLAYAVFGAALAALGTYALVSQIALLRAPEVGIHMATGARPFDIFRLLVAKSLLATAAGVVAGIAAAFALTRALGTVLFGVIPLDGATVFVSALLLLACGGAAAAWPAFRLARQSAGRLLSTRRGVR